MAHCNQLVDLESPGKGVQDRLTVGWLEFRAHFDVGQLVEVVGRVSPDQLHRLEAFLDELVQREALKLGIADEKFEHFFYLRLAFL